MLNMAAAATGCNQEGRAVFVRKWVGFVSALWLMIFSGCYTFANYSSALKEVLGINQKQLNGLGIAQDVGDSCFGIIAGIASSHLPVSALLCISASFGFLGYGVKWLVVSQTIKPLPYWMMFIAAITSGSSVCWMNIAVFNASVRDFIRNRGPVSGLFKACMGLSAAVFFILCDTLFSSSASMYLLMLMTIPTTFCLVSAIFFRPVSSAETQEEEQAEQTSLFVFNTMTSMLAVSIAVLAFVPSNFKKNLLYKAVALFILMGILGALALVPFLMLFKLKASKNHRDSKGSIFVEENTDNEEVGFHGMLGENDDSKSLPALGHDHDLLDQAILIDSVGNGLNQPLLHSASGHTSSKKQLQSDLAMWWCCDFWRVQDLGEDKSTLSLFKTWHYYVFYVSLFCGCGSGIAFSNNLGQVGQSLGSDNTDLFASLFSLGNFFGRLASGNVSEYFIRWKGMPRPVWMGVAKIPMIVLFLWLSTGSISSLYVGSIVHGFGHGSLVTLSVPIISEFYGLRHFGTNFTLTSTYFLTGSYVFSSMAGYLYDRQAVLEDKSSSSTCYGAKCYSSTFGVLASCLTIALACDAVLTVISRALYQRLQLVTKSRF